MNPIVILPIHVAALPGIGFLDAATAVHLYVLPLMAVIFIWLLSVLEFAAELHHPRMALRGGDE